MSINKNGFTLIELLVVMGIIGLLTGLAMLNFSQARQRARDIQRKSELSNLQKALEMYKDDRTPQSYPTTLAGFGALVPGYVKEVPIDPIEKATDGAWVDYGYTLGAGLTYSMTTCLENVADPDRDIPNVACGQGNRGVRYTLTQP